MIAGTSSAAPTVIANEEAYPKSGRPSTGPSGARSAGEDQAGSSSDQRAGASRARSIRSCPRMAAVGVTRLASRAGIQAAASESGTPTANASATSVQVSAGVAAAAAM